jgi:ABC-type transporter Mla maintaining outer membrane lipid asymmetry permease subunit MlaE
MTPRGFDLTVIVFLRKSIGFRRLKLTCVLPIAFLDPVAGYALVPLLWILPITRPLATGLFFSAVFLAIHQHGYHFRLNQWLDFNDNHANMIKTVPIQSCAMVVRVPIGSPLS